jgi:hypothetical protein
VAASTSPRDRGTRSRWKTCTIRTYRIPTCSPEMASRCMVPLTVYCRSTSPAHPAPIAQQECFSSGAAGCREVLLQRRRDIAAETDYGSEPGRPRAGGLQQANGGRVSEET